MTDDRTRPSARVAASARLASIFSEPIEHFLVAFDHAELLTCESFLYHGIGLDGALPARETVNLRLQRIHIVLQHRQTTPLAPQIGAAVFPTLHRKIRHPQR